MASRTCDLGHVHEVCDKCGGVNASDYDEHGAQRKEALTRIQLLLRGGGHLWEAVVCDPCMYEVRDWLRVWRGEVE